MSLVGHLPSGLGRILVTFPVFNEEHRLAEAIERTERCLNAYSTSFQIAVAEDGSTDGTKAVLETLKTTRPHLVVQSLHKKMGRGYALRKLWEVTDADTYVFIDADLSTDPANIIRLLGVVSSGYDIVIGSRYVDGAHVVRPPLRHWTSLSYNWLLRALFKDGVMDHQCGLKAFTKAAVCKLLKVSREDSWFWDTEAIVKGQRLGLKLAEVPVDWSEKKHRRTSITRLAHDIYLHGTGVIRLKSELNMGATQPTEDMHLCSGVGDVLR